MEQKIFLFFLSFCVFSTVFAQKEQRCGTPAPKGNPTFTQKHYGNQTARLEDDNEIVVIPVVFHVLHTGEKIGEGSNVDARQIHTQIDVLNEDFNRYNADRTKTLSQFQEVAASANIRFVLAKYDPKGNLMQEAGIDRVGADRFTWSDTQLSNFAPSVMWNPNNYLNILVVGELSGYYAISSFPSGSGLEGLSESESTEKDDFIMMDAPILGSYERFAAPIMEKTPADIRYGRTLTHEMGHFLGLLHTWGGGSGSNNRNCQNLDYCTDTPELQTPTTFGCNLERVSCNNRVMVQNYMDYADDTCMNLFTKCQVARMRQVLRNSPRRKELLNSPVLGNLQARLERQIKLYPNPSENDLTIESTDIQVVSYEIRDILGRKIGSGTLGQEKNNLNISHLAAGVYVVEVESTEGKMIKKIVKR